MVQGTTGSCAPQFQLGSEESQKSLRFNVAAQTIEHNVMTTLLPTVGPGERKSEIRSEPGMPATAGSPHGGPHH